MMMEFLANAIVGISAAFSGGLIFSGDYWAYWELQLCRVLLDYCKYRFSI